MFQENINLGNCIVQLISYEKTIKYSVVNFKNETILNQERSIGFLNQKDENINFFMYNSQ